MTEHVPMNVTATAPASVEPFIPLHQRLTDVLEDLAAVCWELEVLNDTEAPPDLVAKLLQAQGVCHEATMKVQEVQTLFHVEMELVEHAWKQVHLRAHDCQGRARGME